MPLQEQFEKHGTWLFKNRGVLPLIILLIGMALYIRTKIYSETYFLNNTPYRFYYETFCLLISLFGFGIRVYTVGHTPANTSGRNTNNQVAETLNTTGVYSVVRHPLYLGNFFMWLGPALMTTNCWFIISFCLAYWIYYERIMFAEEQFLRRKFGEAYLLWAAKVPAFIPDFKKFIKPAIPFSWKKVLENEKSGLAATFIIFCAFDVTGNLIQHTTHYNYPVIILCILTLLLYVILKYLKKHPNLLHKYGRRSSSLPEVS
jgi:protein-S-isoprenylcysteine O-methyltransferase Ste14